VDSGVRSGSQVTPYYDPMIAKIISHGATRDEARRRLLGALRATRVLGLPTNLEFLTAAAGHEEFAAGAATTAFIGRHFGPGQLQARPPSSRMVAVAAALCFDASAYPGAQAGWRSSGVARWPVDLSDDEHSYPVHVTVHDGGRLHVEPDGGAGHDIELGAADDADGAERPLSVDGLRTRVTAVIDGPRLHLALDGATASFEDVTYAPPRGSEEAAESTVSAPMNGRVLAVLVQEGERVAKGQRLAVLEAMKMEHQLVARRDGVIERVAVRAGDQVASRAAIVTLQAAAPT
jgi:geranyl-CoA carboxylase alpha subunit